MGRGVLLVDTTLLSQCLTPNDANSNLSFRAYGANRMPVIGDRWKKMSMLIVKRMIWACILLLSGSGGFLHADTAESLQQAFAAPPDSARPWVYWFWLNGNVTKEGISADLEAMRKVGLGGALWMWGGGVGGDVQGPVKFMDAQFWELMRHTIREADRLGLHLNLTNGSGWSHSGGPWIKPGQSMQRLEMAQEHKLTGPAKWESDIAHDSFLIGVMAYPLNKETFGSHDAVNLTDRLTPQGHLSWDVPPGNWDVCIFRHGPTGDRPHPVLSDESGWECDKLSPEAVEANWNGFVLRVLDECGPEARRVVRYTHADSYEFGAQTWSPKMRAEFKQRCGYDPLPYLPAVLGKVVDDPDTTSRFLWDFRRIRADLFAEGIGGRFRELARREGVALTTEPHDIPDVFDQMQYGGHVSEPMGNFLAERRTRHYAGSPPAGPEIHLAKGEVSTAWTYGLDGVVWAEAFTGVDHAHAWKESPDYLRTWGDLWLSEGINRFCFHCWAHSPSLTRAPGITLGPWGIHFDRRNTWFDLANGYMAYLSRSQYMLQQGLPVVDVCMLTGDGVTARMAQHPGLRAAGYDYHGLTTGMLMQAKVVDGSIALPSGMRYRMLVTYDRGMRPATIRKLRELIRDGAVVMGVKPEDAPGLVGFPESRDEVRRIAEELWGLEPEADRKGRTCGQGKVFRGVPENPDTGACGIAAYMTCGCEIETLHAIGVPPDFEYKMSGRETSDNMLALRPSTHRRSRPVFRVQPIGCPAAGGLHLPRRWPPARVMGCGDR